MHRIRLLFGIAICCLSPLKSTSAAIVALEFGTGGNSGSTLVGATLGWSFTPQLDVRVVALGVRQVTTLNQAHPVGIWDANGNLLNSATVQTFSPLTDGARYVSLAEPINLTAGQTYRIGAYYGGATDIFSINTPIVVAPQILYNFGVRAPIPKSSLTEPTQTTQPDVYFGPNFQFEIIPEPASLAAFLIAPLFLRHSLRSRRLLC